MRITIDHLLWVRQVRITISTIKAIQAPTKTNGSIFKTKYGSGTVSDFYSKNTLNIGRMSITDYTFADVTDVSRQYNINA